MFELIQFDTGTSMRRYLPARGTAGMTALQALRDDAGLTNGQRVVVVGASGGVGHYAVQIARALGAEVTGVCSAANVEMVRELGAERVVDYKKERFNDVLTGYDVVFDTIGKESLKTCAAVLKRGGVYVTTVPNGVYLKTLEQNQSTLRIIGEAESNARVSSYMRNLNDSDWLTDPNLDVIEIEDKKVTRISSFILNVKQTTPKASEEADQIGEVK